MKFTPVFTLSAFAATVLAAPAPTCEEQTFGLVSIRSGSALQYASIKKVDEHPHVFSVSGDQGKDVELTLQKNCSLVDQDGRGVNVDQNTGEIGSVDPWGEESPATGFAVSGSSLALDGKSGFYACPSGNGYSLSKNECTGGTGISLHVVPSTD